MLQTFNYLEYTFTDILNNKDMNAHDQIVIIGAGTAGIMTAAQLLKKDKSLDIVLIDPADTHYYQPAWTLVGAGTYDFAKTAKPMKDLIPRGVKWIQDSVTELFPEQSKIRTQQGQWYAVITLIPNTLGSV